jgi:hypothetical protein
VRNFLFGPPGSGGLDLASLNIQRGRDNGLADYNTVRAAYGLPKVKTFAQITSDPEMQATLKSLYGNVNNIDLWVGGLAENHVSGSSMGITFQRILADQFQRLRDGDRFWYQREFSGRELNQINNTTLADIIARNTTTTNMQENVFVFNATISGTVFNDRNRNGRQDGPDQGIAGQTVQLLDADGNLLATTLTRQNGDYQFDEMDLGQYTINVVPSNGWTLTSINGPAMQITRGGTISGVDMGISSPGTRPPHLPGRPAPFALAPLKRLLNDLFA